MSFNPDIIQRNFASVDFKQILSVINLIPVTLGLSLLGVGRLDGVFMGAGVGPDEDGVFTGAGPGGEGVFPELASFFVGMVGGGPWVGDLVSVSPGGTSLQSRILHSSTWACPSL